MTKTIWTHLPFALRITLNEARPYRRSKVAEQPSGEVAEQTSPLHPLATSPLRHFATHPLLNYQRENLTGDLLAGVIVAIMLVPQSMAYALLAGLPPQVGLYASIIPVALYGLFGSSRALAVGPVAIVSLLVATALTPLAEPGSAAYVQLALVLALLAGVIQAIMGLARLGFLVNFLSHPVLSGFTNGAALVIGLSQVRHLLGVSLPASENFLGTAWHTAVSLPQSNLITVAIGLGSVALLLYFKYGFAAHLSAWGVAEKWRVPLAKSAPLLVVLGGTLLVWLLELNGAAGVRVVGDVPGGLPSLTAPTVDLDLWQLLLPTALAISLVGYTESISVAKSLASKRREKVNPNQELAALGLANLGASLTGGYPVTGGISRSMVNYSAGANTGLASIITAVLVALTVIFLMPLFYYLPQAVLAAIILVAIMGLIDLRTLSHTWRYNKADAVSWLATFTAVLLINVETGIMVGVAASLGLFLYRTSRPHVAEVGRLGKGETYRNILRHPVETFPGVAAIRIDESLYFANSRFLEDTILTLISERPEVDRVVVICSAINFIDASALETLEALIDHLRDAGVAFYLTDVKGPVMDRLETVGFVDHIGRDHIFLTTHEAMCGLGCVARSA
jgi:sulfate permease, SulP family